MRVFARNLLVPASSSSSSVCIFGATSSSECCMPIQVRGWLARLDWGDLLQEHWEALEAEERAELQAVTGRPIRNASVHSERERAYSN